MNRNSVFSASYRTPTVGAVATRTQEAKTFRSDPATGFDSCRSKAGQTINFLRFEPRLFAIVVGGRYAPGSVTDCASPLSASQIQYLIRKGACPRSDKF